MTAQQKTINRLEAAGAAALTAAEELAALQGRVGELERQVSAAALRTRLTFLYPHTLLSSPVASLWIHDRGRGMT